MIDAASSWPRRAEIAWSRLRWMINVFARVGFRFERAQSVYHWHSAGAKRLRPLDEIFA